MKPFNWIKQPSESRILSIDCSNSVPSGVTISSVTVGMYDEGENDLSSSMVYGTPLISGNLIYTQILGGVSGQFYDCKVVLTFSNGETAEDDITVQVKNTKVVRR